MFLCFYYYTFLCFYASMTLCFYDSILLHEWNSRLYVKKVHDKKYLRVIPYCGLS